MERRVLDAAWTDDGDGLLRFDIRANAFCHQMVRSIVGLLVDVGTGQLPRRRRPRRSCALVTARSSASQLARRSARLGRRCACWRRRRRLIARSTSLARRACCVSWHGLPFRPAAPILYRLPRSAAGGAWPAKRSRCVRTPRRPVRSSAPGTSSTPRVSCSAAWPRRPPASCEASTSRCSCPTSTPATTSSIVNASKVVLTSAKADGKGVYRHSGYPGGIKRESYADLLARRPEEAVRRVDQGHAAEGPARSPDAEEAEGVRRS